MRDTSSPSSAPNVPASDKYCHAIVNGGRHVCRLAKGHDGEHRAMMNVDSFASRPASLAGTPEQPTQAHCANRTTPAEVPPQSGAGLPASARFRPKRVVCPMCGGSWKDGDLADDCPVVYSHTLLRGAPVPPSASSDDECTNPNCQWLKCAGGLSADLTRFGRELDRVCEAVGVDPMKNPEPQVDAAIAAIEALRPTGTTEAGVPKRIVGRMWNLAASVLDTPPESSPAVDDETVKLLERVAHYLDVKWAEMIVGHDGNAPSQLREDAQALRALARSLRRAPEATPPASETRAEDRR